MASGTVLDRANSNSATEVDGDFEGALDPKPFLWSAKKYFEAFEAGLLPEKRIELLWGRIYRFTQQTPLLGYVRSKIEDAIRSALKPGFFIRQRTQLELSDSNWPEPDFAVTEGRFKDILSPSWVDNAELVIQVATTTLEHDRHVRLPVFAYSGVPEYWIVNLVDRQLEVHRHPRRDENDPTASHYATRKVLVPGDRIASAAAFCMSIEVSELLPQRACGLTGKEYLVPPGTDDCEGFADVDRLLDRNVDPTPFPWNAARYRQCAEWGAFEGRRVELIRGEIFEMSPQDRSHRVAVTKAFKQLLRVFGDDFFLRCQSTVELDEQSEPEPDVAVSPGSEDDHVDAVLPDSMLLAVEVSSTTLRFDRGVKASLYASTGVPEYWIVNLVDRQIEVHRDPKSDAANPQASTYSVRTILKPGETITPLAAPNATIAVADLLPRTKKEL